MPVLEITMGYSPLAFFYAFSTPNVVINGVRERCPWGTHRFQLPPGRYVVELSYPWLFTEECGRNSVDLVLHEHDHKHIQYTARMIRFWPGKLTVDDPVPRARALPAPRK